MLTYEIKDLGFDDVKPFNYVYPEKFETKNGVYYHIGYGLYLKEKTDKVSYMDINEEIFNNYSNLEFVGFKEGDWSNIIGGSAYVYAGEENAVVYDLFVYSKAYTEWDTNTIEEYIKNHIEEFQIPDILSDTIQYVRNRLEADPDEYIHTFKYNSLQVISMTDRFSPLHDGYNKTNDTEFDLAYKFEKAAVTEDTEYIMINNKVGVRVKPYIFRFRKVLKYKPESSGSIEKTGYLFMNIMDEISDNSYAILCEMERDGKIWPYYDKKIVHYIAFRNYDFLKEIQEVFNYECIELEPTIDMRDEHNIAKFLEQVERMKAIETIEKNKKQGLVFKEDDIEENAEMIFKGVACKQNWEIVYLELFGEKGSLKRLSCEYCYFWEGMLVMVTNSDVSDYCRYELPLNILGYLRITYQRKDNEDVYRIGHTFIKKEDEAGRKLIGDRAYEAYIKCRDRK